MLSEQQIKDNKSEFLNLVKSIKRPGSDIASLILFLEDSDFLNCSALAIRAYDILNDAV